MNSELNRTHIIAFLFVAGAFALIFNAMKIQVLQDKLKTKAKATGVYIKTIYPSRGLIYDRNDELLVINEPTYSIQVIYNELNANMDTLLLCKLLEIDRNTFDNNINKDFNSQKFSKSIPFTFLSKLSKEDVARFRENLFRFPGFHIVLRNIRTYPNSNAAHILGYLNEVNQKQIDESNGRYSRGDFIGGSGIEKYYDGLLRGENGFKIILKDKIGREIKTNDPTKLDKSPIPGKNIKLSLDSKLQAYGEELMVNKTGAIIAIEPSTGEILCSVSAPTYDPNKLKIGSGRGQNYLDLAQDSLKPLFNRAISAQYPPASTFKTVIGLIALQEGVTFSKRYIPCNGGYSFNEDFWGCHRHYPPYDMSMALEYSCNTYFYQTFRDIIDKNGFTNPSDGLNIFNDYLSQFGLGSKLGIDVPNEGKGFYPSPKYFDRLYPRSRGSWKSPTIISIGIGQGEIELTTVQLANLAAVISNRGYYFTPHFLLKGKDDKFNDKKIVNIDESYFNEIINGMEKVYIGGTASAFYNKHLQLCGKTGTSQNKGKSHSVFFAFAPKDNPQIAIAVYVENAGAGASVAAPIASLMIEKYLEEELSPKMKYWENRMKNLKIQN